MNRLTLAMIKPDATERNLVGSILADIERAGFRLRGLRLTRLTKVEAERFYSVHANKEFFDGLVEYMTSGPIVAVALEAQNAVERFRKVIGATDPEQAAEGTIRRKYGLSLRHNSIHGSDSVESAIRELYFFFPNPDRDIHW